MSSGNVDDLVRRELEGFFRRRAERRKVYCAVCLVEQLTQRGAQWVFRAAWMTAIEEAFGRPGSLHIEPSAPCALCQQPRPCIGAPGSGPSAPP